MKKNYTIYQITNQVNGKIYIGQTIRTLEQRKAQHIRDTFTNNSQCVIHRAIKKYGIDKFVFEALFHCLSKADMDKKERETIRERNSKRPAGYNLTDGGEGSDGYRHNEEAKRKIGAANKGRKMSKGEIEKRKKTNSHTKMTPEHKARLIEINKARKLTDEQKKKISRLGTTHSDETKEKMRVAHRGRKSAMLGKKHTREAKARMSMAHKGCVPWNLGIAASDETKTKMSLSQLGNKNSLGHKHSDETRAKMSASKKGVPFTEEHRAKVNAALRLRAQRKRETAEQIKERMSF